MSEAKISDALPALWGVRIGDSDTWGYVEVESDADFIGRKSGLSYEKRPFYLHPQPAELAEQQGDSRAQFEDWYVQNAFDYAANPIGSRNCGLMRRAWHAALAATGKQQVGEACEHCENGIAINSNFRTEESCRHCQQVGEEMFVEEGVYCSIADMIEPYVQREGSNPDGPLPASVHDSVSIIFDHWLKTRVQVGEVQWDALATIVAALEDSRPVCNDSNRSERLSRHNAALAYARALAARQPGDK